MCDYILTLFDMKLLFWLQLAVAVTSGAFNRASVSVSTASCDAQLMRCCLRCMAETATRDAS